MTECIKMCLWFDLEALIFDLGNSMKDYGEVIEKSWKAIAKQVYKPCKHCVYELKDTFSEAVICAVRCRLK